MYHWDLPWGQSGHLEDIWSEILIWKLKLYIAMVGGQIWHQGWKKKKKKSGKKPVGPTYWERGGVFQHYKAWKTETASTVFHVCVGVHILSKCCARGSVNMYSRYSTVGVFMCGIDYYVLVPSVWELSLSGTHKQSPPHGANWPIWSFMHAHSRSEVTVKCWHQSPTLSNDSS